MANKGREVVKQRWLPDRRSMVQKSPPKVGLKTQVMGVRLVESVSHAPYRHRRIA